MKNLKLNTCRVGTCGRTIVGDPLVLVIEQILKVTKKSLSEIKLEEWVACHSCANGVSSQIRDTRFSSLAKMRVELERRIAAQVARKDARTGAHAFNISSLSEAFSSVEVKTEGRDGRKLVGAAASAVVRKAITTIADADAENRRKDVAEKAAREKAVADKKSALAAQNAARTVAAVGGGK